MLASIGSVATNPSPSLYQQMIYLACLIVAAAAYRGVCDPAAVTAPENGFVDCSTDYPFACLIDCKPGFIKSATHNVVFCHSYGWGPVPSLECLRKIICFHSWFPA